MIPGPPVVRPGRRRRGGGGVGRGRRAAVVAAVVVALGAAALWWSGALQLRSEPARFASGDVELTGRLFSPRWTAGRLPGVVVVHGSGPTGWRDMKPYARRLATRGMAVLLYDKRGVGGSGGTFSSIPVAESEARLTELADDARAALDWLRRHPRVDPDRVGMVGASQAGWILPLAVERGAAPRFLVAISGPAVPYGVEVAYSRWTGDDTGATPLAAEEIDRRGGAIDGDPGYDPSQALHSLSVPTLWLLGGADTSVPTARSRRALERIREETGAPIDVVWYPDGTHTLRRASGGRIDYWPRVATWLRQRDILR